MGLGQVFTGVDKKLFALFCLVFGFFWSWNWVVFQSPTFLTVALGSSGIVIPSRSISLVIFALVSLAIFLYHRTRNGAFATLRLPTLVAAGISFAIIVLCDVLDGSFDGIPTGLEAALAGGCAFGVLGALIYDAWGRCVAAVGLQHYKLMIVACIVSSLLASLLSWGAVYLNHELRQVSILVFAIAIFPLASWFTKHADMGATLKSAHRASATQSAIPVKFVVTLVLLGASLGLMQGIFTLVNEVETLGSLASIGFALAAVFVALAVFVLDLNFNRLLYQVGFVLLALGFLVLAGWGNGLVGYLLSVTGYRFSEIIAWMLCVYLMARLKRTHGYLFPLLACALGFGQALGLLCYDGRFEHMLPQIAILVATVLLVSALMLVTTKSEQQSWGIVTPADGVSSNSFSAAIEALSADALFTAREAEVFGLLARGKNRKAISGELVLSENTIKTHIAKVYRKLGVSSQQELIGVVERHAQDLSKNDIHLVIDEDDV